MKKLFKIFIMFALVLSFFSINSLNTEAASTKTAYVDISSGTLTVRSGAGTKYKKVGSLKKHAKVTVYSTTKSGWSEIRYNKKKAYVMTKYLKFADSYAMDKRLDRFFEQFSLAAKNGDYEKLYDMWYWGNKDIISKSEAMKEIKTMKFKKFSIKLVRIEDDSAYVEDGMTFMKVLVKFEENMVYNGTKREYNGLAYAYVSKTNDKYGFLLEDDIDELDK